MRKHRVYKIPYKALKRRYKRNCLEAYIWLIRLLQYKNDDIIKLN